jgi:hypothetical protein
MLNKIRLSMTTKDSTQTVGETAAELPKSRAAQADELLNRLARAATAATEHIDHLLAMIDETKTSDQNAQSTTPEK